MVSTTPRSVKSHFIIPFPGNIRICGQGHQGFRRSLTKEDRSDFFGKNQNFLNSVSSELSCKETNQKWYDYAKKRKQNRVDPSGSREAGITFVRERRK